MLVKALDDDNIQVIKKGAQYFCITTEQYMFNDCLHFSTPCNYSNYLDQWGVREDKSIFPYQLFSSVEELEATVEFPAIEAFYSNLTEKNVSVEDYMKAKTEYETRRRLPGKYKIYNIL